MGKFCQPTLFGLWSSRSWVTVPRTKEVVDDPLPTKKKGGKKLFGEWNLPRQLYEVP